MTNAMPSALTVRRLGSKNLAANGDPMISS